MWDLSLLHIVPGLRIAVPRDGARLRQLLRESVCVSDGPTVVRFPKGTLHGDVPAVGRIDGMDLLARSDRRDILMIAVGATAALSVQAARLLSDDGVGVTVIDPRWVKPVRRSLLDAAARHRHVLVVEDGIKAGGVADAVRRCLAEELGEGRVRAVGLPQRFIQHGRRDHILAELGLDPHVLATDTTRLLRPAVGRQAAAVDVIRGGIP
jgi:1-deoxy-D-xylulose-5-phosphate synthase